MAVPSTGVAQESVERLVSLGLNPDDLTRFYQDGDVRWHSASAHAAEMWDFFMAEALTLNQGGDVDSRVSNALRLDQWQFDLLDRLGDESSSDEPLAAEGAIVMAWLAVDFTCWLSRLPDDVMGEHGARLLGEMLRSEATEPMYAPQSPGSFSDDDYVSVPIVTNGKYADRFLQAWGDHDLRILDFYRAGIVDRALIKRYIAEGIETDMAQSIGL